MSFADPAAFLFLLAVVPLALLYLFRAHTRTMHVPSLLFWEGLEEHPQPEKAVRMRRFLTSPLFWIQLGLVLLLTGSMARPVLQRSARKVLLIIDVSASMQTREQGGTRLDAAKKAALSLLDELKEGDRAALITVDAQARLAHDFSNDRARLRTQIRRLKAVDTPTNMPAALSMVPALQDSAGSLDVVILSDRRPSSFPDGMDSTAVRYAFHPVGAARANAGFVSMERRRSRAGAHPAGADLLLRNYAAQPRRGAVRIFQQGQIIGTQQIQLPSGGTVAVSIASLPADDPVSVAFEGRDSLAVDDRAFFIPSPAALPAMLVITEDERVARTFRRLDDFRVTIRPPRTGLPGGRRFDVYVYDRTAPSVYPDGGTLVIDPPASHAPIPEHEVYDWDAEHPVLRDVVVARLPLAGARILPPPPPWAAVLARTRTHPLIMAGTYEGYRRIITALDLSAHLESPATLLLLLKALDWINPLGLPQAMHVRTGTPYIWHAPADTGAVTVITPDGTLFHPAVRNGLVTFPNTARAGVYTLAAAGKTHYFAANLLDADESDIRPPAVRRPRETPVRWTSRTRVSAEYGRWGLWAFIGLLMIEWGAFFLRRGL